MASQHTQTGTDGDSSSVKQPDENRSSGRQTSSEVAVEQSQMTLPDACDCLSYWAEDWIAPLTNWKIGSVQMHLGSVKAAAQNNTKPKWWVEENEDPEEELHPEKELNNFLDSFWEHIQEVEEGKTKAVFNVCEVKQAIQTFVRESTKYIELRPPWLLKTNESSKQDTV